jgi:CRISPR-associated protein Cmr6
MARGNVVQWNGQTGFIRDEADGQRCFFGDRSLRGLSAQAIHNGLEVEFDRGQNDRGPTARNVRPVGASKPAPPAGANPVGRAAPTAPRMGGRANPPVADNADPLNGVPVPQSLRQVLERVKSDVSRHPGLLLDRFIQPCKDQEQQRDELLRVAGLPGDAAVLAEQRTQRAEWLRNLSARVWQRVTLTPLTLHLARASALENAGLCLHPLYGFAYLPGSGLKGMARAYAETVWLAAQPEAEQPAAWQRIEEVFGWAPSSDRIDNRPKPWKPTSVPDYGPSQEAAAGSIVFHEAWPTQWPKLLVDIVNNHYSDYYQGDEPPGDWQSPVPVYFLAIQPGTAFEFALSKRRAEVPDELLQLAQQWLDGALEQLGCGAKTAAGYGAFRKEKDCVVSQSSALLEVGYTLELLTPAYLAGASQRKEDCDLRSATLRGLLRWWWRAMHAGFVDVDTLRCLEAAVWGSTDTGGAVGLRVSRIAGTPELSPYKSLNQQGKLRVNEAFAQQHGIPLQRGGMAGIVYAGYGMDEIAEGKRKQRWYMPAGAKWRVELTARAGHFRLTDAHGKVIREASISPEVILEQAKAALWWFCMLGGAGSKSRKGFGSMAMPTELASFQGSSWITLGNRLRTECGYPNQEFREERVGGPSLKLMRQLSRAALGEKALWVQVQTGWNDPWRVLDLIGRAMMACAGSKDELFGKHRTTKMGLGLPRKIHGPNNRPLPHQNPAHHQPPLHLEGVRGDRHSSPVLFHVSRDGNQLTVHVAGFPTADLRESEVSATAGLQAHLALLIRYLQGVQEELQKGR